MPSNVNPNYSLEIFRRTVKHELCQKASRSLIQGFIWANTIEGEAYWRYIADFLQACGERLELDWPMFTWDQTANPLDINPINDSELLASVISNFSRMFSYFNSPQGADFWLIAHQRLSRILSQTGNLNRHETEIVYLRIQDAFDIHETRHASKVWKTLTDRLVEIYGGKIAVTTCSTALPKHIYLDAFTLRIGFVDRENMKELFKMLPSAFVWYKTSPGENFWLSLQQAIGHYLGFPMYNHQRGYIEYIRTITRRFNLEFNPDPAMATLPKAKPSVKPSWYVVGV